MKTMMRIRRTYRICLIASCLVLSPWQGFSADASKALPMVIEAGFASWEKGGGVDAILMTWGRGGLLEGSNKAAAEARFFRSLSAGLGSYKSHELIRSKPISGTSQVTYISINFDRGVVYGRFHLYQSDKGWVVQNMDFSERPEAVMPWLAFEGEASSQ